MSEEDYARFPFTRSSFKISYTLYFDRFLEHSKTTHAMGRPGTVQEVSIFEAPCHENLVLPGGRDGGIPGKPWSIFHHRPNPGH